MDWEGIGRTILFTRPCLGGGRQQRKKVSIECEKGGGNHGRCHPARTRGDLAVFVTLKKRKLSLESPPGLRVSRLGRLRLCSMLACVTER
jgi:hypothetical protein